MIKAQYCVSFSMNLPDKNQNSKISEELIELANKHSQYCHLKKRKQVQPLFGDGFDPDSNQNTFEEATIKILLEKTSDNELN